MNYGIPDFYNTGQPAQKKSAGIFVLILHMLTVMCLIMLTVCAAKAVKVYEKEVEFKTQPPPPVEVESKQCTTEQALQWWAGSKDLNTVRAKLCGSLRTQSKQKGKSS